jgi:hypothetical protein
VPRARPSPAGLPTTLSLPQLVYLLDVSGSRVSQLVVDGVIKRVRTGRYAIVSIPDFIRYLRGHGSGPAALSAAKSTLAIERAALAKLNRMERERLLVPAAEVARVYQRSFSTVQSRALSMSSKLASRLATCADAIQAKQLIDNEVREFLQDASQGEVAFEGGSSRTRRRLREPEETVAAE